MDDHDRYMKLMDIINDPDQELSTEDEAWSKAYSKKSRLRFELGDRFRILARSGKLKLDLNGHYHGISPSYKKHVVEQASGCIHELFKKMSFEELEEIASKMKSNEPFELGEPEPNCLTTCHVCDEQLIWLLGSDGVRSKTKCPYPNGMPEYGFELPVPSGKLVAANDLRHLFDEEYMEIDTRPNSKGYGFNINTDYGIRGVFETYGKLGMAHGFVGNSCPGIYRINENTLTISMIKHNEESWDNIESEIPGERVGSICTDLWWYSVVDYDDFVRRTGRPVKDEDNINVIDVKPGLYKVVHRTHTFDRDANVTDHYAVFKWMRELNKADIEYGQRKRELPVETVEDTVRATIIGSNRHNRFTIFNQMFFTNGNGYVWRNGCLQYGASPKHVLANITDSDSRIPVDLEEKMKCSTGQSIYPICKYAKICNVPDDVRPDWLDACFEALEMAIGMDPDYVCTAGYKNSDMIKKAKKIKKELKKRFNR